MEILNLVPRLFHLTAPAPEGPWDERAWERGWEILSGWKFVWDLRAKQDWFEIAV